MVMQYGQEIKDNIYYPLPDTVKGVKAQLTE